MNQRPRITTLGAAAVLLLAPSCIFAVAGREGPADDMAVGSASSGEDEEAGDLAARFGAELQLQLARLLAESALLAARAELAEAETALVGARFARDAFLKTGRELELVEARLDVDREKGSVADAEAELSELEAMYAEEEFAERTKELVLSRGRRQLEFARRDLALSQGKLAHIEGVELVEKEAELQQALVAAEHAVAEARRAVATAELQGKIDVHEAEVALTELDEADDDDAASEEK